MSLEKEKRPVQATVGFCGDDMALIDDHRGSTPFLPSRAAFILCATRFTLDIMRRGQVDMERLFSNYLKAPLTPLTPFELAQAAQLAILREACLEATDKSAGEADGAALLFGYQMLKAIEWIAPEVEQERERLSA